MFRVENSRKLLAQSLQLVSLISYLLLLIFIFKEGRSIELIISIFVFGILLDQLLHFFVNRRFRNPIPSLITSCAVIILLTTHFNLWPYFLALIIGLMSKYFIRIDGRHVFNPASFGLFCVILIFSEQSQIKFSQWLPNLGQYILLFLFGLIVAIVARRFWVALSYFGSILLLTSLYGWLTPELPFLFLIGTLFSFSVTLFAFHMITDPATTPEAFLQQIGFGTSVGILDFLIRRFEEPYAPFYALLFISALWHMRKELHRWVGSVFPLMKFSSLVLLFLFYVQPTEAANICSRSKVIIQALKPKDCASFDLTKIETLDLSSLGIKILNGADLIGLTQLRNLDLSENELSELPQELIQLRKIENLDISNNLFKVYPKPISNLKSLKTLDVSYNLLEQVESLTNSNLENINFFHNNIKTFPRALTSLKKIRILNFGFNYIEKIPEEVSSWRRIETLIFNYNKLKSLPKGMKSWKNLVVVDFHRNLLRVVPEAARNWQNIEIVDFSENNIEQVPDFVGVWKKARSINFSQNKIHQLNKSVGRWKSLIDLDISNNQLEKLPSSIGLWKNLVLLKMNYNKISKLPDTVDSWKKLIYFSIHHNRLSQLPQAVGEWDEIRKLELYNNYLEMLPKSVGQWRNLKELDLRYNKLGNLPKQSKSWFSLEKLLIVGNPTIILPKGLPPSSVIY